MKATNEKLNLISLLIDEKKGLNVQNKINKIKKSIRKKIKIDD